MKLSLLYESDAYYDSIVTRASNYEGSIPGKILSSLPSNLNEKMESDRIKIYIKDINKKYTKLKLSKQPDSAHVVLVRLNGMYDLHDWYYDTDDNTILINSEEAIGIFKEWSNKHGLELNKYSYIEIFIMYNELKYYNNEVNNRLNTVDVGSKELQTNIDGKVLYDKFMTNKDNKEYAITTGKIEFWTGPNRSKAAKTFNEPIPPGSDAELHSLYYIIGFIIIDKYGYNRHERFNSYSTVDPSVYYFSPVKKQIVLRRPLNLQDYDQYMAYILYKRPLISPQPPKPETDDY